MQPVDIVLQETNLLSLPSAAYSDILRLKYRWLIENAKIIINPASRHALAEIVRNFNSSPSDVLILFDIITRERIPSNLPPEMRQVIFYKPFCEDIIKACRHFLIKPNILSARDFRSVLYVSGEFDPYYISNNCFSLFSQCSKNISSLMDLSVHVMCSNVFQDYPAIVINSLRELREINRYESEFTGVIDTLIEYWEKYEASVKEHKANRLAAYEELRGGVFHEIGHLRENLFAVLDDLQASTKDIEKEWEPFGIEIDKILSLVRRCIAFGVKTTLCSDLDKLVSIINFHLGEGKGIISHKGISDKQVRDQLRETAKRITELLFDKDGIRMTLNSFDTNIKSVTRSILEQHKGSLEEKKISVERSSFPDELCVVYGEESDYKLILHNLVENVCNWSKGSRLLVAIEIDESDRFLILRVIDDGVGLSDMPEIGHGLRKVESLVNRYYGEFDRQSMLPDKYRRNGYTMSVTIKLPYLQQTKEGEK